MNITSNDPLSTTHKMQPLHDLIPEHHVFVPIKASKKKSAIQAIADKIAYALTVKTRKQIESSIIFESLMQREHLGSTGLGNGVALPHARLKTIDTVYGFFARFEKPIEFDAMDNQAVDIVFILVSPEDAGSDHLKALARVSRVIRSRQNMDLLRSAKNVSAAFAVISGLDSSVAA